MFGFGAQKKTPQEIAKDAKKDMRKTQRDLGREKSRLERDEAKLIADIKKAAKQNNTASAKILAKQLVQLRAAKERLTVASSQVGSVSMTISAAASSATMAGAMSSASASMASMNKAQDPAKLQATLQQFQKQSDIMGMQEELLDDALTDAFDCDEEEEDAVVSQVMDELGMDMAALMAQHSAPTAALPGAARAVAAPAAAAAPSLPSVPTAAPTAE